VRQVGERHLGVDLPGHALLEREVLRVVDERGAGLELEEPQPDAEAALGLGLQQHLGAAARGFRAVRRRGEHAELPAEPVLLRRRPVGVEQVPLEQNGVGDRADLVQRVHGASFRRRSRVSSQVVITCFDR
jgi:hypothetical protein